MKCRYIISAYVVHISNTNDGGKVVYGHLINFLLTFNQLLGAWGILKLHDRKQYYL